MQLFTVITHYMPVLVKAVVVYCLKLSPVASLLDLKNALVIASVRAASSDPDQGKLGESQHRSLRETPVEPQTHVVEGKLTVPTCNVSQVVQEVIKSLGDGSQTSSRVETQHVSVEWIGHRTHNDQQQIEPGNSQIDKYSAMMRQVRRNITVLYFHGGQFWRMGRAPRSITHVIARDTGGRCLAVKYRLSPQHPFPAALIDGLVAYLSLLYPPPGSLHSPIAATDICFAGDSAGGNLVIALLQIILEVNRQKIILNWNGQPRELPVPAGVSALSPYLDMTRAVESEANLKYDIVPGRGPPFGAFGRDSVWPASPPRHHVYANDNALLHPLVSPVTARNWTGSPPVWICVGEECLAAQGMFVAQQMASQKVPVVVEQYSAMPHNFVLVVPDVEPSRRCKAQWVSFIQAVISDAEYRPSEAWLWNDRPLRRTTLDISHLVPLLPATLRTSMKAQLASWGFPPA